MLGEHEDKPLLLCSNTIGPFWRNRSESGFCKTSIRSLCHKYRNPGDRFECNRSSQYLEGPLKILRPYFDFDTCTVPFLMILFRILSAERGRVPSTTLLDYKQNKTKTPPGDSCVCVISGVTSSDTEENFYIQLFLQVGVSIGLEYPLWLAFLSLISSSVLPFLAISSQQLYHFCVPK